MRKNTFRILVTGASSGIGYSAAQALALEGHTVFAAARRLELMEPLKAYGVTPVHLDVTSSESITACLAAVGEVDVLVNNAGYGSLGALECVSLEEARRQMDVNLFGLAALCKAVLPGMRERGFGRIINVSSIAGRAVVYFGGWYNVSKYAVEAFSDALRMEMKPFGVDVVLIEPGGIKTSWGPIAADHLSESCAGTPYADDALREASVLRLAYSSSLFPGPAAVTRAILPAVQAKRPRARYLLGFGSRSLVFWHSVLPARWWDALARMLASPRVARFAHRHLAK